MENKIIVAGIGPGAKSYVTPAALEKISTAKFLVGGRRALAEFSAPNQTTCAITKNLDAVINFVREKILLGEVVVMASGDPGYYSILDLLRKNFAPSTIEVIPSISAIQLAFAKLALSWHNATLLSFHGRIPPTAALQFEPEKLLGMLTDDKFNSATISEILLENGWDENSKIAICARLSYPDEKIIRTTLAQAAESEPVKNCILIVGKW